MPQTMLQILFCLCSPHMFLGDSFFSRFESHHQPALISKYLSKTFCLNQQAKFKLAARKNHRVDRIKLKMPCHSGILVAFCFAVSLVASYQIKDLPIGVEIFGIDLKEGLSQEVGFALFLMGSFSLQGTDSERQNVGIRQFKHQTLFATQTQTQRNLIMKVNQICRICHTFISHWAKNLGYVGFEFGLSLSLRCNLHLVLKLSIVFSVALL